MIGITADILLRFYARISLVISVANGLRSNFPIEILLNSYKKSYPAVLQRIVGKDNANAENANCKRQCKLFSHSQLYQFLLYCARLRIFFFLFLKLSKDNIKARYFV